MRAVRADGEKELDEELVRARRAVAETGLAVLAPDEGELARPVSQKERTALIADRGGKRAVGEIEARPGGPSPSELVLQKTVAAESRAAVDLIPTRPGDLAPREEMGVDRASQGTVAERGVGAPQAGRRPRVVVSVSERASEIEIRRLAEIAIGAN